MPWGTDGLSLDLMRRDKTAQSGLNDFLIVEAIKAAPGLGVKRVSLNFAMFRAALERGERIGAGPVLKAWRGLLVFLSRWFQIESLYKFNAKFSPVLGAALLRLPRWQGRAAHRARGPRSRGIPRLATAESKAVRAPGRPSPRSRQGAAQHARRCPPGDDPPYPPMSAQPGLIAKTAIVSGPAAPTKCAEGDRPSDPPMSAQPGLIAKTATVSGPAGPTRCAEGDDPLDPQKLQGDPVPGRKGTAS